jgi:hypothetical protein
MIEKLDRMRYTQNLNWTGLPCLMLYALMTPMARAQQTYDDVREVRDRTPKEAIESFFSAIADGNADAACSLLVSPGKMREYCRIQSQLSVAFRDLADAGEEAFGEDGRVFRAGIPAELAVKRLAEVQPVTDGDHAVWPANPKAPMKLKRIDGHWKLDLYSSFNKPEQLTMANLVFEHIGTYVTEIATGIREGAFESVAEVQAELRQQRQLMNEKLGPKLKR